MPEHTHRGPVNIIGLDLSLSSTGFHRLGNYESGAISTAKMGEMERIDLILARIADLVHEGDLVIVENNAFHARGRALSRLAELNGIVKFWLWRRKIPYVLVAPTTLKKFILGSGKGEKSFILREVSKDPPRGYGLDAATDDEADACVLAHIGACLGGREQPRNQAQREVLHTVDRAEKAGTTRKLQPAAWAGDMSPVQPRKLPSR